MTTAPLRAAIIGTSRVGSFFDDLLAATPELIPSSHAGCYAAHPRTQLVAGCDLIPERLAAFGDKWGVKALYSDFREMLAKERPDVVSVCTSWSHTHDEIVPEVVRAGVRALWAEKPLATSMAKANEIIQAVEANGVKLQGTCPRRWLPRYQAIRSLIERGEIGEVLSVTVIGAEGLLHHGTHDFDAMAYFAGDPEPAFAVGHIEPEHLNPAGRPVQDARGNGYIVHTNGVRFSVEGLSENPVSFLISGTKGRISTINDCRDGSVDLWRRPADTATKWLERELQVSPATVKSPPLQQLEDLIDALDDDREPICGVYRSARQMEYGLALHSSHRRGGARVAFPLEDQGLSIDAW
jgi:predicted dehydrogenase